MPQMAPIMWLPMFIYITILLKMLSINLFFFNLNPKLINNFSNKNIFLPKIWKW